MPDLLLSNETSTDSNELILEPPKKPYASEWERDVVRDRRTAFAAAIESELSGKDMTETLFTKHSEMTIRDVTGAEEHQKSADTLNNLLRQDMADLVANQIGESVSVMEAQERAELGASAIQQQEEKDTKPQAKYMAYVDSISSPDTLPETREGLAVRYQLLDAVMDIYQDIGILELVKDIGLDIIFAPKPLIDRAEIVGFDVNPFKQEEKLRNMVAWFRGLPPEEKLQQFPVIAEDMMEDVPRHLAAAVLAAMVDPSQEEDVAFEFGPLGVLDTVAVAAGIYGFMLRATKLLNPIRSASEMGNQNKASEMNLHVMRDEPQAENLLGIDRETAVTNATGFDGTRADTGAAPTMSAAMQNTLMAWQRRVDETLSPLVDEEAFVREGLLDAQDADRAFRTRIQDEWSQYVQDVIEPNNKFVSLDKVSKDSRGVTFEFTAMTPDGLIEIGKKKILFNEDDVTFWQNLPDNVLKNAVGSEKWQLSRSDALNAAKAAIRLDTTSTAVAKQFQDLAKEATASLRKGGPFSRKEKIKTVDAYLIYGDEVQKVFTESQLKQGVNGMRALNDDEIEAYMKLRTLFTGLGLVRNYEVRLDMLQRGVRKLDFGGKLFRFGEIDETAEAAQERIRRAGNGIERVWIQESLRQGRSVLKSDLDVEDLYLRGYRLTKIEDDILRNGATYKHVFVKTDRIGDLPAIVTDMKPGYVPRLNKKATWFVQRFRNTYQDGVPTTTRKAMRSFDNEADAVEWARRLSATAPEGVTFRHVADGELEAFRAGSSGRGSVRGLVTGPRSNEKIPHGMPEEFTERELEAMRMGAFEALEMYLENTKNFMTRNQWRQGLQKKWENTARFQLASDTNITFDNPGAALEHPELRDMHERIREWSGFYSKSERGWENTVKNMYEWGLGKLGRNRRNRISDFLINQRDTDPLAKLRAATFHSLLGFFNPIQLWVQAQGAAVALAANLSNSPARLFSSFQKQHGLSLIQHYGKGFSDKIDAKIAKATGFEDLDDMRRTKELWDRTGYYESTRSSADVEQAARGYPTSYDAWRKTLDTGLMFFRAGELFNRRYSFLTALDEFGGSAKVMADSDLFKQVIDRTNDLMLNLGKSNRAAWQKGVLSIPTQFLQIQAKTLETVLGLNGALSIRERWGLFLSQAALYGPAGMVMGGLGARYLQDAAGLDQIDINQMPEENLALLNGGITDWTLAMMGIESLGSDRGALFNGMDQSILAIFTEENTGFETLLGPSSVPITRFFEKLRQASPLAWTPAPTDGRTNLNSQDLIDAATYFAEDVAGLLASPFSSMSQVSKWQLMQDLGQIRDANGEILAHKDFNLQTELATLIGFKPELLQRKFDLGDINEQFNEAVDARVSLLMYNHSRLLSEIERASREGRPVDGDMLRRFRKKWEFIVDSIQDPQLRRRVRERYQTKVEAQLRGESQLDRQVQRYYRNFIDELVGEVNRFNSTRVVKTRDEEDGIQ